VSEIPKPKPAQEQLLGNFDGNAELRRFLGLVQPRWGNINSKIVVIEAEDLTDEELENFVKGKPIREDLIDGSGSF